MEHTHVVSGDLVELILKGRFTFADNKMFSSLLEGVTNQNCRNVVIDLEGVDFIDSAALGILLLARDKCERASVKLLLRNPIGQVRQMFKISKFNELFKIEEKVG